MSKTADLRVPHSRQAQSLSPTHFAQLRAAGEKWQRGRRHWKNVAKKRRAAQRDSEQEPQPQKRSHSKSVPASSVQQDNKQMRQHQDRFHATPPELRESDVVLLDILLAYRSRMTPEPVMA